MRAGHLVFAAFVVFLFVGGAIIQGGIAKPKIELKIDLSTDEQIQLNISYSLKGSRFYSEINVLCFPISKQRVDSIYLFDDPRYVDVYLSRCIHGLYDHLRAEIDLLDADNRVLIVNFEALLHVFAGNPAIVVLAGGIPNGTEFALAALDWVERGGVLITLGNESIPFLAKESNGEWIGGEEFLRVRFHPLDSFINGSVKPSEIAEAFDFKFIAPRVGISIEDVENYGGRVIGYHYEGNQSLTSAALFTIGNGTLVAFSSAIYLPYVTSAEDAIASDIAKIVVSQLQWISGPIVFKRANSPSGEINGIMYATFSENAELISVLALSTIDTMSIYAKKIIEVHMLH
jgi:hypothetical protein